MYLRLLFPQKILWLPCRFNCSHTGDYTVEDVSGPACQEPEYNEINLCNFKVSTTASVLGRCFIEVPYICSLHLKLNGIF